VLDRRTNTLIIKDLESRMPELEALLDLLDQPTRQVQIEARIVETTKDFSKGWGFNWGFTYLADRAFGNQTGFSFPRSIASDFLVNLPISGANTTATLGFRNILNTFALDVAIQALEDRGRGRIISRPMVVVQNNEEAEIESGVQIPITTTTATEIDVTFVSASLKLTVTPQITADDNVIMDIEVENNQPVFLSSSADNASISTRQAKTVVRVGNGGTTVIGGIYQVNEGVSSSRTPFLSRIPLLGWLFRNKRIDRTNDELLIFLTPRIQEG
jgi:type IV pilus assembly protein PilQ